MSRDATSFSRSATGSGRAARRPSATPTQRRTWPHGATGNRRGRAEGPVGLSTKHALAIVARDGAKARDVVAFARRVQTAVAERFGVRLTPEPVFWGVAEL